MNELSGQHRADAAIVGGGLMGLLLGSSLAHAGMRIVIVDAGDASPPAWFGACTVLRPQAFRRIEAARGIEAARTHAAALQGHLQELLSSSPPYVQETTAYLYARTAAELPELTAQRELLSRLGLPISTAPDAGGCPFPVELSLMLPGQAVMDGARWITSLRRSITKQGGRIFHRSRVIALDSTRICTAQGCVDAPLIILAAGKPPGLRTQRLLTLLESRTRACCPLTGHFPLHHIQLPIQAEGLTLCPAPDGAMASWDAGRCGSRHQQERIALFEHILSSRMPDWQPGNMKYHIDTIPADGLPFIGSMPGSRHLFAAGYDSFGILGAMHAAAVLTRRILSHPAPEDRLYVPDRAIPRHILLPTRRAYAARYARNMLRRRAPSCAHCGCRMRYFSPLQLWECPCCGSAYTMLGQISRGPGMCSTSISVLQRPDL